MWIDDRFVDVIMILDWWLNLDILVNLYLEFIIHFYYVSISYSMIFLEALLSQ